MTLKLWLANILEVQSIMADRISQMTMHRMKKLAIKTREEMMSERSREESASSRFSHGIETGVRYGAEDSVRAGSAAVKKAYRQYGEKKIRNRNQKARRTDKEVARTEAEVRSSGRVRLGGEVINAPRRTRNSQTVIKGGSLKTHAYERQRNYTIRKLRKKSTGHASMRKISNSGIFRRSGMKSIKVAVDAVKSAALATKSLVTAIAAAGSTAVLVIVICVLLSAAVYLFGQDTKDEYSAEALGVGDTLIMRVTSAQLGNVGGLKFCKWYGFGGRVEWCACFVSWCADQCGYIDKGIIPKFAVVGDGVDWFKARGRFRNNKYIPHPGDVIFFDWDSDGTRDHVGFVERCDGKTVYTIEGNSGDACRRLAYRVGHPEVLGYGVPQYEQKISRKKSAKEVTETKAGRETDGPNIR